MKYRYLLDFEKTLMTLEKPKILLVIKADSNDGDYITTETEFEELGDALECLFIIQNKLMGTGALRKYDEICTIQDGQFLELVDLPHYCNFLCHSIISANLYLYDTDGCRYEYTLKNGRRGVHYNSVLDKIK